MGLISNLYDFEIELPNGSTSAYLIPKDQNNLFLFQEATHGNGIHVEIENGKAIFHQNSPFVYFLISKDANSGSNSTYHFDLQSNGFELVKLDQASI